MENVIYGYWKNGYKNKPYRWFFLLKEWIKMDTL